ncbi:MAG: hypothetical protein RLY47_540 [Candidatus Parcubacteria bacterium]|jgi:hypothetical protein
MVVKIPGFPKVVVFENYPRLDARGGFQLQARLPPEFPHRPQRLVIVPDSHGPIPVQTGVPYEIEFCMFLGKTRRWSIMALVKALRVSDVHPEPVVFTPEIQAPKRRVKPPLRALPRPPLPSVTTEDLVRRNIPFIPLDRSEPQRRHFKPSARPRMRA